MAWLPQASDELGFFEICGISPTRTTFQDITTDAEKHSIITKELFKTSQSISFTFEIESIVRLHPQTWHLSLTPWKTIPGHQVAFADLHKVTSNPASFSNDLAETESQVLDNFKVGSVPYVGALFQRIDVPPGSVTPMHRMLTLGYGVIASGEAELVLDSGDIRVVKQGDTVVERASMHQWKNLSRTEWLRVIWVLIPILPVEVGGKKLEEEFKG
ncbi:unnamed protein product [Periconia digitata]|uniref:Uncharacterized protein n=1 Tax=Periconia digitata TaxID=1303443 RepID=A0A9W4U4S7_9PLEO|nr:unnamed protein product [Periconia digitata]